MNFYVTAIRETVEHIENSLDGNLSLSVLAAQAGISDFHFDRMFKTVSGVTLKQYILGRRLTRAAECLSESRLTVIDIALDLGFTYPEVFSRAFKRRFGLSPAAFRKQKPAYAGTEKARIVEREIVSGSGSLRLKGNLCERSELRLAGIKILTNPESADFQTSLRSASETFFLQTRGDPGFIQDVFYTAVRCCGESGFYTVFCGREPTGSSGCYESFDIPQGLYAAFRYRGDMFDIREVFIDDLYRWILSRQIGLRACAVGMLNIYRDAYPGDPDVLILVPVEAAPATEQERS